MGKDNSCQEKSDYLRYSRLSKQAMGRRKIIRHPGGIEKTKDCKTGIRCYNFITLVIFLINNFQPVMSNIRFEYVNFF
jgi:hypothetical protein